MLQTSKVEEQKVRVQLAKIAGTWKAQFRREKRREGKRREEKKFGLRVLKARKLKLSNWLGPVPSEGSGGGHLLSSFSFWEH